MAFRQGGSSHGVVYLQTWCPQQASEHICRCAVRQATDVSKDGVTTSGYGAENTRKIRGVGYSPVGNEVSPSYATNVSFGKRLVSLALSQTANTTRLAVAQLREHEV